MTPRREFMLLAALAGALLSVLGYVLAAAYAFGLAPSDSIRTALLWSPAGALAASGGAWVASAWHRRSVRNGGRCGAAGMSIIATVLALLVYPVAAMCWLLFTGWLDRRFAAAGLPLHELLNWLPAIVLMAWTVALLVGTLPAFAIFFLLSRRYLRKSAGSSTVTA